MVRQYVLTVTALTAFAAMTALMIPSTLIADQLIIENVDSSNGAQDAGPNRGMSMNSVESRWGAPLTKRNAVGDPPISRWEYSEFVVYFEYKNVIHAVQKN